MDDSPLNVHEFRVRTHQTDLNAAMYHGAYFDIFDDARIETFRRMARSIQCREGSMVVARTECSA